MAEPQQILELFGKRAHVIKPGLERMRRAWQALGCPGAKTPTVLVAGTNGKGSTSGMLWHMLACLNARAGYFSSPHLKEFRERVAVSDREITNELLLRHLHGIKEAVTPVLFEELTFFEVNTLLALSVFAEAETEINVLEVGMGGRFDCTNVVDPCLSLITSIGRDHVQYLGDSTIEIAREKAGIMRSGVVCLWGGVVSADVDADRTILTAARETGTPIRVAGDAFRLMGEHQFAIDSLQAELPARVQGWPNFLQRNFVMASAALIELARQNRFENLTPTQALSSMLKRFGRPDIVWPITLTGRFHRIEVRKEGVVRQLLVDVCHNPHGAKALAQGLEETGLILHGHRLPALICVLADKDDSGIWAALEGKISEAMLFKIPSERSWTVESAKIPGLMYDDFSACFTAALDREDWASPQNQPWLVCGSVAAIGEVLQYFQDHNWQITTIVL